MLRSVVVSRLRDLRVFVVVLSLLLAFESVFGANRLEEMDRKNPPNLDDDDSLGVVDFALAGFLAEDILMLNESPLHYNSTVRSRRLVA